MDVMIGAALTLGFVGVALVSGIIALVSWRVNRRKPWVAGGIAAVSVALVVALEMAMPPGYRPAERRRIERLHAQFAPTLERYRKTHGEYPPTLEAAGIATPDTPYGPLRYTRERARDGSPSYSIAFGDYYQNGFTASWESESGEWYLDE
jgi:hypothetical protein